MNRRERALLVGMSIGDGYVKVSRQKPYINSYRSELRIKHSRVQRPYLEYKASLLKKIFGGKCTIVDYDVTLKSNGKTYQQSRIVKANKYFRQIKGWLYPNGCKFISRRVLEMLNLEGLAIWYMDDGSMGCNRNKHGEISSVFTILNTQCSSEEADTIIEYFKEVHNIQSVKGVSKGAYILRFNTKESHKYIALIFPYIVPSMKYKIRLIDKLRLQECQTSYRGMMI